jgi:hypothetical protein
MCSLQGNRSLTAACLASAVLVKFYRTDTKVGGGGLAGLGDNAFVAFLLSHSLAAKLG